MIRLWILYGILICVFTFMANDTHASSVPEEKGVYIEKPDNNIGYRYTIELKERVLLSESTPDRPVYRQEFEIVHIEGNGQFLVVARPPRGANVIFSNGENRMLGSTSTVVTGSLIVDCRTRDPELSEKADSYMPIDGDIQLWSVDPITGSANDVVKRISLPCSAVAGND